jgi:FAD/FMN-containing dehydrogenase
VLAPLRQFGAPVMDGIRPMSYLESISLIDTGNLPGQNYYMKASTLHEFSDDAIDTLVEFGAKRTSPRSVVVLEHLHGAATRVDPQATAYALRQELVFASGIAAWTEGPSEPHIAWSRAMAAALEPHTEAGIYVNFLADEGQERIRASYGVNYERLAAVKRRYDPTNFFHLNQNILPAAE